MTPSARLEAVITILGTIGTVKVPMDTVIGDYMRRRRYIGSKDRAFIANRVYECVRHKARVEWHLMSLHVEEITPRLSALTTYAFLDDRNKKDLEKLFDGSKYGPEKLSVQETKILEKLYDRNLFHKDMPEDVWAECPPEYEEKLRAIYGDNFATEMAAMLEPAPLDVRVNIVQATREKVKDFLKADGVETEDAPYSPWGLRAKGKTYLSRTKAFAKGWIDIQDEGSQLIALACGAEPGQQIIDYCAGAGGKTIALANAMEGKGRIVAMDIDTRRLNKSKERFKRARVSDNVEVRPLEDAKNLKWLKRQKGKFDIILLDVPCSGSGTWRRNPDMRWITYGPDLEELQNIQAEIMGKVRDVVKPGGKLVYATCSLFREENENQVEKFLKENDDFVLVDLSKNWPSKTLNPCEGAMMRLTPAKHQTDGFFTAVMQKKS